MNGTLFDTSALFIYFCLCRVDRTRSVLFLFQISYVYFSRCECTNNSLRNMVERLITVWTIQCFIIKHSWHSLAILITHRHTGGVDLIIFKIFRHMFQFVSWGDISGVKVSKHLLALRKGGPYLSQARVLYNFRYGRSICMNMKITRNVHTVAEVIVELEAITRTGKMKINLFLQVSEKKYISLFV